MYKLEVVDEAPRVVKEMRGDSWCSINEVLTRVVEGLVGDNKAYMGIMGLR